MTARRKWTFRLACVFLLPVLVVFGLEAAQRLAGYGYSTSFFLKREIAGHKFLVENDKFGWRFFGPDLARTPRPMELPADKRSGTCRIFIFGESAAYGDPKPEFGLPRFLEVLLRDRFPGINFEVVNAAMTGINSHVILPIARDCGREDGDIWVIYMGNNEVVGPFGSGTVFGRQTPNLYLIRGSLIVKGTRTGELLSQILAGSGGATAADSEWGGMAMFVNNQVRHDDPRMPIVYDHFKRNLEDILQVGLAHRARLVVSTVVSNLKDCAPFGSQHRSNLTAADRSQWERAFNLGIEAEKKGHVAEAIEQFQAAGSLDDHYAELHFRWGRCCLALGQDKEAQDHFVLARDFDTLRFRADTKLNDLIRAAAAGREREGIQFVDSAKELAQASRNGIPGEEFLYEHVHLNFSGNYRLGLAIAKQVFDALPQKLKEGANPTQSWLSETECGGRLAWTGWDRCRTTKSVLLRLNQPPFTSQCDYQERYQRVRQQLEELLPGKRPAGLRQAVTEYRQALAFSPQDWVLQRNLAHLQRNIGDPSGAEVSMRKAVALLPHDPMGHLELGLLLVQSDRAEEAIAEFEVILSSNPGSIAALNGLALALSQLGRQSEAINKLETALKLKPHSADTQLNLGTTLDAVGRKEEAEEHLRQGCNKKLDTPELLIRAGKICMTRGWVDQAITNFKKALDLNPTDATVQSYLGGALDTKGIVAEAQEHFAEAVRLDPEFARGHLGLGIELSRQGKDSEAAEEFSAALKLDANLVDARLRLGISLMRQRNLDDARRQFEQVLTIQPTNRTAQEYLMRIAKVQSAAP